MITYDYSGISSNFANWFNSGNGLEDYIENITVKSSSYNWWYTRWDATIAAYGGIGEASLTLEGSYLYYSTGYVDTIRLSADGIGTIYYSDLDLRVYNYADYLFGSYAEKVIGSPYDDHYYGYGGNDELNGNAGNDILYGGSGNDKLNGGSGNDILYGGSGTDYAIYGSANNT